MRIQTPEPKHPSKASISIDSSNLLYNPAQASIDSITESKDPSAPSDLKGLDIKMIHQKEITKNFVPAKFKAENEIK